MRNIVIAFLFVFLITPLIGVLYQWITYDVVYHLNRGTAVYAAKIERDWLLRLLYLPLVPALYVIQLVANLF